MKQTRPTTLALNRPRLILGVEQKMLGLSLMFFVIVGANGSRIAALFVFAALIALAKKASRVDDRLIQIAPSLWRQRRVYDPLKREVFHMKIVASKQEEE